MTRTFKVSGLLVLAGTALAAVASGGLEAFGILLLVFAVPVFSVSLLRLALRKVLWRVGNRLFVSYLLVGLVPFGLASCFLLVLAGALAGQQAGRRVEASLRETARALVETARDFEAPPDRLPDADTISVLMERYRAARPGVLPPPTWAYLPDGGPAFGPFVGVAGAPSPALAKAAGEDFAFALAAGKASAVAAQRFGRGLLFVVLPLDERFAAFVEKATGVGASVNFADESPSSGPQPADQGGTLSIDDGSSKIRLRPAQDAVRSPGAGPGRYLVWPLFTRAIVHDWRTGAPVPKSRLAFVVRTGFATEISALFGDEPIGDSPNVSTRRVAIAVLKALGGIFGVVALVAVVVAALLVLRIARTTSRLWAGFGEVEKGNFGVRLKLGGSDQLSALVDGFNSMAGHLAESVAARAEAEAVERELETARQLQRRLLPPDDYAFPGLSIAADFRPAAAIGGDFYQFLERRPGRVAAVVADVSGHGLPTGIVMASVRATLSALSTTDEPPAKMFARLDEELVRTTDPHLFVTMAHLLFDFEKRTVSFTNAGHLYPWRVEPSGRVTSLENPARPLGVHLPHAFRTVEAPLVDGDLWVLLSDGIVEGESPAGELFGFDRMERILAESGGLGAVELRNRILSDWRGFTGGDVPADDRTLLVLKVTGELTLGD